MFFGKTKKKNKPTTIEHPVLGTLIKKTDWYTKKSFIITLWDKTFDLVSMYILKSKRCCNFI